MGTLSGVGRRFTILIDGHCVSVRKWRGISGRLEGKMVVQRQPSFAGGQESYAEGSASMVLYGTRCCAKAA